jgi:hypothetical protein
MIVPFGLALAVQLVRTNHQNRNGRAAPALSRPKAPA